MRSHISGRKLRGGRLRGMAVASLWVAVASACGSVTPRLTISPVRPPATGTYQIGKFVWYDLVTDDVPAVKRFYAELFNWQYEEIHGPEASYTVIKHEGAAIGGIVALEADENRVSGSRWLSLLSVPDVDEAVEQVKDAGGSVKMTPRDFPNRGRLALVTDPQGAMVVFVRATGGDPPDGELVANRWMWTELWVQDVQAAVDFYGALVDYETDTVEIPGDENYRVFMRDGRRRAGVNHLPWPEITSNWLPYLNVEDAMAIAERVEELGGQVLIAPRPDLRSGSVGILTDPSGAAFAIQVWPVDNEPIGGAR